MNIPNCTLRCHPTPLLSAQKYSCTSMPPRNMFWKNCSLFFSYINWIFSLPLTRPETYKSSSFGCNLWQNSDVRHSTGKFLFPSFTFFSWKETDHFVFGRLLFKLEQDYSRRPFFLLWTVLSVLPPPHPYFFFLSSKWSFACISWREWGTRAMPVSATAKNGGLLLFLFQCLLNT